MNTSQTIQEQIKISVSPELKSLVKFRAQNIGVPITQYVKNLIINDVKQSPSSQVSDASERRIGQSLKDLTTGRYTVIRDQTELDAHLNSLE